VEQSLEVGASAHAAADVRAWLDEIAPLRVLGQAAFDARLLVTELVANSVRHAGVRGSEQITVRLTLRDAILRVEVIDPGTGFAVEDRPLRPVGPGGRGLLIVDAVSSRWGVNGRRPFTTWFEIDLPDPARAAQGPPDGTERVDAGERLDGEGPRTSRMSRGLRWPGVAIWAHGGALR
jgi:anti-sigma regulatory factor (Ser/Thr protein kinase)